MMGLFLLVKNEGILTLPRDLEFYEVQNVQLGHEDLLISCTFFR